MPTLKRLTPWLRALGVLAAISVIVGRVTFAALQSQQAVLAGNTIESATASLQLSTDGGSFATTQQGFAFNGVIPGGPPMPSQYGGKPIWFKNNGSAPLVVKALVSTVPTTTGGIDLSKVFVVLTPAAGGPAQSISIAALQTAATNGGIALTMPVLSTGTQVEYSIQVSMANDAFSGNSATVHDLNLVFSGGASVPS